MEKDMLKGRGAAVQPVNRFITRQLVTEHDEGIDEEIHIERPQTEILYESPAKVVNKIESPDVGMMYSLNPYQGCEHGCAYCYARTTHEFWGLSSGLDFESKIIVKKNAPELLERHLLKKSWSAQAIVLSGNTDCYQPVERDLGITRKLLEVFAKYRHPVGIITKNTVVLRDLDILRDLAHDQLVRVYFSITSLDESLRSKLEPRTATAQRKLTAIRTLTDAGVPVGIMNAPIIPGLNHHESPAIIKAAADAGALTAGYTVVRLNGTISTIFESWLKKHFPDRYQKVWNQISEAHGGKVNDSNWERRMRGEGPISDAISQLFHAARDTHMKGRTMPDFNTSLFRKGGNYRLF
jgi:DNA repair photolyase